MTLSSVALELLNVCAFAKVKKGSSPSAAKGQAQGMFVVKHFPTGLHAQTLPNALKIGELEYVVEQRDTDLS